MERAAFKQLLDELNAGFGDALDIKYEPLGWEDTLASTGRRSQEVMFLSAAKAIGCRSRRRSFDTKDRRINNCRRTGTLARLSLGDGQECPSYK